MTTTLSVRADALGTLMPGDRITSIDGQDLPEARTVAAAAPAQGAPVEIVNTLGTGTVWRLYPDGVEMVTIERGPAAPAATPATDEAGADPAGDRRDPLPSKSRRPVRRTIAGLDLVSLGGEHWQTADGRHRLSRQEAGITFCDGPHPVRISRGMVQAAAAEPTNPWWEPVRRAIRAGKRGYLCEGGVDHPGDLRWYVLSDDLQIEGRLDSYATLHEAAGALARALDRA